MVAVVLLVCCSEDCSQDQLQALVAADQEWLMGSVVHLEVKVVFQQGCSHSTSLVLRVSQHSYRIVLQVDPVEELDDS